MRWNHRLPAASPVHCHSRPVDMSKVTTIQCMVFACPHSTMSPILIRTKGTACAMQGLDFGIKIPHPDISLACMILRKQTIPLHLSLLAFTLYTPHIEYYQPPIIVHSVLKSRNECGLPIHITNLRRPSWSLSLPSYTFLISSDGSLRNSLALAC